MPAAYVPITIDQGEDFVAQIIWTDDYDEPQAIEAPARMDIKTSTGAVVASLATPTVALPEGSIPAIGISESLGLIQLYMPYSQTAALIPGEYVYDLFCMVDDGDAYAGSQRQRLIYGPVTVNKSTTQM